MFISDYKIYKNIKVEISPHIKVKRNERSSLDLAEVMYYIQQWLETESQINTTLKYNK